MTENRHWFVLTFRLQNLKSYKMLYWHRHRTFNTRAIHPIFVFEQTFVLFLYNHLAELGYFEQMCFLELHCYYILPLFWDLLVGKILLQRFDAWSSFHSNKLVMVINVFFAIIVTFDENIFQFNALFRAVYFAIKWRKCFV